jgi:hypothetical protein
MTLVLGDKLHKIAISGVGGTYDVLCDDEFFCVVTYIRQGRWEAKVGDRVYGGSSREGATTNCFYGENKWRLANSTS